MKLNIHPEYKETSFRCACGATWETQSTKGVKQQLKFVQTVIHFLLDQHKILLIVQVELKSLNVVTTGPDPRCWKNLRK